MKMQVRAQLVFSSVAVLATFSGCKTMEQTAKVLDAVTKPANQSGSTGGRGGAGGGGGGGTAQITAAQQAAIKDAMFKNAPNSPQVRALVTDLSPVLQRFLEAYSCMDADTRALGIYTGGRSVGISYAPMWFMKYHNKGLCLTVARISNWQAPALNALSLEVTFHSDGSGEARSQRLTWVKEPDGVWLLRETS